MSLLEFELMRSVPWQSDGSASVTPDAYDVAYCLLHDFNGMSPNVARLAEKLDWPLVRVKAGLQDLSEIGLRRAAHDLGLPTETSARLCAFVGDYSPAVWIH